MPDESEKTALLRIARKTISEGCTRDLPPEPDLQDQPERFCQPAACFVTLHKHGALRGCIGSTVAHRSLLEDVVHNAFASAFRDSRFPPVTESELSEIRIEISLLTPQQRLTVTSEDDLLQTIRPGIDGLLIRNARHSATFLPQVWQQLPDPRQFLQRLKIKAGMAPGEWPDDMECFCYQCVKFAE